MKYRKKPVVIEAWLFYNDTHSKAEWLERVPVANIGTSSTPSDPDGMKSANFRWFAIPTLEGVMEVSDGDFIIKGVQGEFYPCKPEIFAATYEAVNESDPVNR